MTLELWAAFVAASSILLIIPTAALSWKIFLNFDDS